MDITKQLRKEHSKANTVLIGDFIFEDPSNRIPLLINCLIDNEIVIHQRASAVMGYLSEKNASLFIPYLDQLLICVETEKYHVALSRNFLKVLQNRLSLSEESVSNIINYCFTILEKNNLPVALHAYSITFIQNELIRYPELANELKVILEDRLPYASAAFRYRAKVALAYIKKHKLA